MMVLFNDQMSSKEVLGSKTSEIVHVHYDYESQQTDELTLRRGCRVEVISKDKRISGSQGWWTGKVVGSELIGIFPSGLVAEFEPNVRFIDEHELNIGDLIGCGGFGQVHQGKFGDIEVAIKSAKSLCLFPAKDVSTDGNVSPKSIDEQKRKLLKGILREGRIFAKSHHRNIIQFYGVCPSIKTQNVSLVMEYAHGGSLSQILQRRRRGLMPDCFLNYGKQIAEGMKYLHEELDDHIIHRDLKCSNILIFEKVLDEQDDNELIGKTLKITDFGLAKGQYQSTTKSSVGTYPWMSPESIKEGQYSTKSDVWSYGVLLWELLTGEIPYKGIEGTAIIFGIGTGSYSLPIPADFPEQLASLIKICWAKNPDDRPTFTNLCEKIDEVSCSKSFESYSRETFVDRNSFNSMQTQWQNQIEAVYDNFKAIAQQIELKEKFLNEREIQQEKRGKELAKWAQNLKEMEDDLVKRQLKIVSPKIEKRSGLRAVFDLVRASSHLNSNSSRNPTRTIIGNPQNFQHLVAIQTSLTAPYSPITNLTGTLPAQTETIETFEMKNRTEFPSIDADAKSGIDFVENLNGYSNKRSNKVSSKPITRPKTILDPQKQAQNFQNSNTQKEKCQTLPPTGKRKSKGSRWYIDAELPSSSTNTPSSTQSTPTLGNSRKNSSFSSQTSLNPQMNDHSLANGLLSATNLLATVGFGHAVTEHSVSTKEKNTETIFPTTVNLNHSVSENGMGRSQFSTRSSSPIRKQHKRTSSSPLEHLSMPKSNSIYFHIQDRPNSTPSKHETLPPLSIAPPPPPTSSSRQNPFSLSDSHLLNCRVDTSNQFGNKSMSSSRPRFHYSSSTSGLWNYDERARHSSLLDIDTEEQKEHRARVLPAEINETVPIPHHSLEKEFLG